MKVEREIISYLYEYGNTRENDIINYGARKFSCSSEEIKKAIKRMVVKDEIHYLVHSKLEPPEVYISLKEPLPPKTLEIILGARIQAETAEEDVRKILEEAAAIAKQETKECNGNTGNAH